jgi:gliding motility-associated-like protein
MVKKLLVQVFLILLLPFSSFATHIVGGSFTYEHLGGSTYRLVLRMYRDCSPSSVQFAGTQQFRIYLNNGTAVANLNVPLTQTNPVNPVPDPCSIPSSIPNICLEEGVYMTVVNNLGPGTGGYHVFTQVCCRNASLLNVVNPLNTGESFHTFIPDMNIWLTNNSPVWNNLPPVYVCAGIPLNYNHGASDVDGDSLVYSMYTPYSDPFPTFPGCVFTPITWVSGFAATNPLNQNQPNTLNVNPNTGQLLGTPCCQGQYVAGVLCKEYRNGILISEIQRDFQFNVIQCQPPANPSFTISGGNCAVDTVCFTNTSTNTIPGTTVYSWDFGDPNSTTDTVLTTSQQGYCYYYPSSSGPGPFVVTLVTNPGNSCSDTIRDTVYIGSATASYAFADSMCSSLAVQFTDSSQGSPGNNVTGWSWNFGDPPSGANNTSNLQNPTHIFSNGGTYYVTLVTTTQLGCMDTLRDTVHIIGAPVANAGNDTISCTNNATVPLGGTIINSSGGMWIGPGTFNPNNTTLNATYTPTAQEVANGSTTLYLVTTGLSPCGADTDSITITFYPGPTVDAGPDSVFVCKDTSCVPLSGVVTVATGGQWTAINGTGTFTPSSNVLNTCYSPSSADTAQGNVVLVLTSTGNGSCNPSRDTITIIFTATPSALAAAPNDTACAGSLIPLSGTSSTGTGYWTTNGTGTFSPSNTANNPTYQPSAADAANGSVTFVFNSSNNGGCQTARDTLVITLIPSPTGAFTSTLACPFIPLQFTDQSTSPVTITGWQWIWGDATPDGTTQNPTHAFATGGPHVVTLVVTSQNGCVDSIMDTVNVYYQPVANFADTGGCLNQGTIFADLSSVTGAGISSWIWNFGDGSPLSNLQNPVHVYPASSNYNVTLIVTSTQGCMDTITLSTTVLPVPTANFTADDFIAVIGQNISFTDQSSPVVSWSWNFGDSTFSNQQNPQHAYATGGIYTVVLIVTDANGCQDTITHEVIISLPPAVPSGFSPNGDNQNDILYVYGGPYKELEFRIYNNWGELIFRSDKQSVGWDGTKDGKLQPIGVYVWTVRGVTEDNELHELKGDVSLIR